MQKLPTAPCSCNKGTATPSPESAPRTPWRRIALGIVLLVAWFALYKTLLPFSQWFTYSLLGFGEQSHLGSAI